jgi:hypothetical protein
MESSLAESFGNDEDRFFNENIASAESLEARQDARSVRQRLRRCGNVRMQFQEIRSKHATRMQLPEELWRAVRLGLNVVAPSLRLNVKSLKKWMGLRVSPSLARRKSAQRAAKVPAFVQFFAPGSVGASNCVLDVESRQGAKLHLEWKGATSSETAMTRSGEPGRALPPRREWCKIGVLSSQSRASYEFESTSFW